MAHSHSRGQSLVELTLILALLTSFVVTAFELTTVSQQVIRRTQLSGETR